MQTSSTYNIYYFTIETEIRFSFVALEVLLSDDPHTMNILIPAYSVGTTLIEYH
jgi:hypothetical protein